MDWIRRHRPSPAMVVAVLALLGAFGGSAIAGDAVDVAKKKLISGSKIKKRSISGNRLKRNTVTGKQVAESKLGKVPKATNADKATTATNATNATNATTASTVSNGAISPSKIGAIPAARVTRTTSQTVSGQISVSFDSERFDVGNMHDAANPTRVTAPITGVYTITGNISWSSICTSGCFLAVQKNDTTFLAGQTGATTSSDEVSVATVAKLNAGDFITLRVQGDGGSVDASAEFTPDLAMAWIAPG